VLTVPSTQGPGTRAVRVARTTILTVFAITIEAVFMSRDVADCIPARTVLVSAVTAQVLDALVVVGVTDESFLAV